MAREPKKKPNLNDILAKAASLINEQINIVSCASEQNSQSGVKNEIVKCIQRLHGIHNSTGVKENGKTCSLPLTYRNEKLSPSWQQLQSTFLKW